MRPNVNDLVVTLVVGDETHVVVVHHLAHLGRGFGDQLLLFRWDDDVVQVEGQTTLEGHGEPELLDVVEELRRTWHTHAVQDVRNDAAKRLLGQKLVDEARLCRHMFVKEDTSTSGVNQADVSVDVHVTHLDGCVQVQAAFLMRDAHFFRRVAHHALAFHLMLLGRRTFLGDVVQAQDHVLRRNGDGGPVGRVQNVVRAQHQQLCFQNGG